MLKKLHIIMILIIMFVLSFSVNNLSQNNKANKANAQTSPLILTQKAAYANAISFYYQSDSYNCKQLYLYRSNNSSMPEKPDSSIRWITQTKGIVAENNVANRLVDYTPSSGNTYYYRLYCEDQNDPNLITFSNILSAHTSLTPLPSKPNKPDYSTSTNVDIYNNIHLSWNDLSDNEDGFFITVNDTQYTYLAPPNSTSYTIPNLGPSDNEYRVQIYAFNDAGYNILSYGGFNLGGNFLNSLSDISSHNQVPNFNRDLHQREQNYYFLDNIRLSIYTKPYTYPPPIIEIERQDNNGMSLEKNTITLKSFHFSVAKSPSNFLVYITESKPGYEVVRKYILFNKNPDIQPLIFESQIPIGDYYAYPIMTFNGSKFLSCIARNCEIISQNGSIDKIFSTQYYPGNVATATTFHNLATNNSTTTDFIIDISDVNNYKLRAKRYNQNYEAIDNDFLILMENLKVSSNILDVMVINNLFYIYYNYFNGITGECKLYLIRFDSSTGKTLDLNPILIQEPEAQKCYQFPRGIFASDGNKMLYFSSNSYNFISNEGILGPSIPINFPNVANAYLTNTYNVGTNYLLTYQMTDKYSDHSVIWGLNMNFDGSFPNNTLFPLNTISNSQYSPHIAISNNEIMTAWLDNREATDKNIYKIFIRKYNKQNGSPIDPNPIALMEDPSNDYTGSNLGGIRKDNNGYYHTNFQIASNGTDYLLLYHDPTYLSVDGTIASTKAIRFNASGNILDSTPNIISTKYNFSGNEQVIWTGSNYLIVYYTENKTLCARKISSTGAMGSEFSYSANNISLNAVVSNNNGGVISGKNSSDKMYAFRIDKDGNQIDSTPKEVNPHDSIAYGNNKYIFTGAVCQYITQPCDATVKYYDSSLDPTQDVITLPKPGYRGFLTKSFSYFNGTDFEILYRAFNTTYAQEYTPPSAFILYRINSNDISSDNGTLFNLQAEIDINWLFNLEYIKAPGSVGFGVINTFLKNENRSSDSSNVSSIKTFAVTDDIFKPYLVKIYKRDGDFITFKLTQVITPSSGSISKLSIKDSLSDQLEYVDSNSQDISVNNNVVTCSFSDPINEGTYSCSFRVKIKQ